MYKINLHILENCNYKCKYCFSKFNSKSILNWKTWIKIIENCEKSMDVSSYNIAGGEPLLYKDLKQLLTKLNKPISIITNASLIDDYFIDNLCEHFYMIGISIDSFNHETNIKIGRNYNQKTISYEQLELIIKKIRQKNKNCIIKLNTVVSKDNFNEELWQKLKNLKIDKWKILKSKKFKLNSINNFDSVVDDEEYNSFLERNIQTKITDFNHSTKLEKDDIKIIIEPSMESSYLFIDSNGYLIDNSNNTHKQIIDFKTEYKKDILKVINFDFNNV